MPTTKKITSPKRKAAKRITQPVEEKKPSFAQLSLGQKIHRLWNALYQPLKLRINDLLLRRPHRSFRRTRRRDYVRSLKLPGYWSFTSYVHKTLWQHKKLFFWLIVGYGVLTFVLIGLASQDTYTQLSDTLRSTSGDIFKGSWGQLGQAGLLLATGVTGDLNNSLTSTQQVYAALLALLTWLTTVWLLRAILAGHTPKLRDGVYNAGAPIISTFLVALVCVIQLLPIAVAMIGFSAAITSGLLDGGGEAMVFWIVAALLTLLSAYWLTSTLIALVVVTLPGMYPLRALKVAGDLVIGRRVRIMLRLVWLLVITAIVWIFIMVPIIIFDSWIKGIVHNIQWIPIVPTALLCMSTVTLVWAASYMYLLYRKVVDDDAAPA
jgi:hypothetical protein